MSAQTAFALFLLFLVLAYLATRLVPKRRGEDAALSAAVYAELAKEFMPGNVQIDVKTFDGAVILGGAVREFDQAKRAMAIASGVAGVKSVENRMSIRSGR